MSIRQAAPATVTTETATAPARIPPIVVKPATGLHWLILSLAVAVVTASCALQVRNTENVIIPFLDQPLPGLCTFKRIVGVPCPGCGMTRSFVSLAHAQWANAWRFNPVGFLFFAVVVFQIPYRILQLARIRRGRPEFSLVGIDQWVLIVIAFALLIQWLMAIATGPR